jgi:hypothetical protein
MQYFQGLENLLLDSLVLSAPAAGLQLLNNNGTRHVNGVVAWATQPRQVGSVQLPSTNSILLNMSLARWQLCINCDSKPRA